MVIGRARPNFCASLPPNDNLAQKYVHFKAAISAKYAAFSLRFGAA